MACVPRKGHHRLSGEFGDDRERAGDRSARVAVYDEGLRPTSDEIALAEIRLRQVEFYIRRISPSAVGSAPSSEIVDHRSGSFISCVVIRATGVIRVG